MSLFRQRAYPARATPQGFGSVLADVRKACINMGTPTCPKSFENSGMYNVLIVDEEEHLLWALEKNLFPDRDDIEIITANSGEEGLEALRDKRVDLLVSDIKMPGKVDGFQLILRAKEVAPDSRVIIMTAFGTNRIQNFADRIGITHYIEKPFNVSELRDAILELLDEKEGFQGVLSDLELTDIIQMLCLAKRTALLHLKHKDHRGKIVFDNGDVVHSEFDGVTGDEAVFRMLALRQGDIFMQSDFQNDEETVTMSWQDLLFEGVKRADEERASSDEVDDDTDVGMGVSNSEVNSIVAESGDVGSEPSVPFFSEEELAEIEMASEPSIDDAADEIAEELAEDLAEELSGELDDFDAEFDAEESSAANDESFAESEDKSTSEHPAPTTLEDEDDAEDQDDDSEEVVEFRAPFREPADSAVFDSEVVATDGFQAQLVDFARDCPSLRITGIISPDEGMALDFVEPNGSTYEPDALAVFFGDVVAAAERTIQALHESDLLNELQITLEDEYVILRRLGTTPYIHVAVVGCDTSLGVALVLMRRFQKSLNSTLEP